jgi:hypothetical protein
VKRLFLLKNTAVLTAPKKTAIIRTKKPTGTRKHARINVAVPVKVTSHDNSILAVAACTYEVSLHGCKLANTMGLTTVDQLVWVNRKNRKAAYKVVWTSPSKNQVGLRIADSEKLIWDDELVGQLSLS